MIVPSHLVKYRLKRIYRKLFCFSENSFYPFCRNKHKIVRKFLRYHDALIILCCSFNFNYQQFIRCIVRAQYDHTHMILKFFCSQCIRTVNKYSSMSVHISQRIYEVIGFRPKKIPVTKSRK